MNQRLLHFSFILFLCTIGFNAQAASDSVAFDGSVYKKISEDFNGPIQVIEYIPEQETAAGWTHKLAFRHYPHLEDARAAGAMLDASLKQDPTNTIEQSIARRDGNESLVSYLHWPAGADHMEYQIIRYMKQAGITGLVTYQYTYRFKPMESAGAPEEIAKDRKRWLDALAGSQWPLPAAFSQNKKQ